MKLLKIMFIGLLLVLGFNALADDYVPSDTSPFNLNVGKILVSLNSNLPTSYSYVTVNYPDYDKDVNVDSIVVNDGNCKLSAKGSKPTTFYYVDCEIESVAIDIGDGDEWTFDVPKF